MIRVNDAKYFVTCPSFATVTRRPTNKIHALHTFHTINKNTFGENFHPADLIGTDLDKKNVARKAVRTVTKIMAKDNLKRIISNMEHVIKKFDDADKREFFVLRKKCNDCLD